VSIKTRLGKRFFTGLLLVGFIGTPVPMGLTLREYRTDLPGGESGLEVSGSYEEGDCFRLPPKGGISVGI
jgi:hypothetical protein